VPNIIRQVDFAPLFTTGRKHGKRSADISGIFLNGWGLPMLRTLKNLRVPLSCIGISLIIDVTAVAIDHVSMAVLLYWLRCVHRLAYGLFEFMVAFGMPILAKATNRI
jgi:hypothetical protein